MTTRDDELEAAINKLPGMLCETSFQTMIICTGITMILPYLKGQSNQEEFLRMRIRVDDFARDMKSALELVEKVLSET